MTSISFLLLLAAPAPAPASTPVSPAGNPQSWVTNEDYPAASLRTSESGTVGFRLYVDSTGAVPDCTVTASSGFERLDSATCALLKARARFRPARNVKGEPVDSTWSSRFRWELPVFLTPEQMAEAGTIRINLDLAPDGRITSCSTHKEGLVAERLRGTCEGPDRSPFYEYVRSLAPRYRSVTLRFGSAPDVAPALPRGRGAPLLRRKAELLLPTAPGGRSACRTTLSEGADPFQVGPCEQAGRFGVGATPSGANVKFVVDLAVGAVKR